VIVVKSRNGVPLRLTQERWRHIVERHPEMENQKDLVLETLRSPDLIQQGDLDTLVSARFYRQTPLTEKFLMVIYKEVSITDGFVLTAYFTNKPSEGRKVLWTR
jgi:hypothetical protein